jgi:site-specific DNA recombinase
MKAAGYIRVSTAGQAKEGESLSTQTSNIKHFIEGKGWELINIYEDRGLSGSKAKTRPGFMNMMQAAKEKQFEGIVFSRLSRFARNAGDFLHYRDQLKENEILLFSIKEGIDPTTKTGKLMMGLIALIAEWERETIKEQMSENKMIKWTEHRTFIGKPPFGYIWNKEAGKLEINEGEAETYKRIVSMYCDLGMSFKAIALKLKEEGIRCKKAFFSSITISYILKNPCYYGNYTLNRHVYKDGKKGAGTVRTKELKPESEQITFPIPALISKLKWDSIQKKTDFNKIKSKRSDASDLYWLRGLLECGECGAKISPRGGSKRKDGTNNRYYCCYWAGRPADELKLSDKKKCRLPYIKAKSIEAAVWERLMTPLTLGRNVERLSPLVEKNNYDEQISKLEAQTGRLAKELMKKKTARDRIYDLLEDENFDTNELKKKLRLNKDEQLELEAKLEESRQKRYEVIEFMEDDNLWIEFVKDKRPVLKKLGRDLLNLSIQDKKRVAQAMIVGKIKVETAMDESGIVWGPPQFEMRLNIPILKALMEEGKLGLLDNNYLHHSSVSQFRRIP